MAFQPVYHTIQVEVRWTQDGQPCENTFHYGYDGTPPDTAVLQALNIEVWQTIGVKMQRQMASNCRFVEVHCRDLTTQVANQATYPLPAGTNGTLSGDPLPNQNAIQLTTRTGRTGRSSHGAKRFGGLTDSVVSANTIAAQLITYLIDLALSVAAHRIGTYFTAGIASRLLGFSTPIQSVALTDTIVDSQDSRKP